MTSLSVAPAGTQVKGLDTSTCRLLNFRGIEDAGVGTFDYELPGDDVAQLFHRSIDRREQALGESFSAVAPYAMSLLGCCRSVADLFGTEPNLAYVSLQELAGIVGEDSHAIIESHVVHSPCSSIAKGKRLLDYEPRYTTEQIFAECIEHLLETDQLRI